MHQPENGATGATRRRGDVIMEDVVVVKEYDKSSPKLFKVVPNLSFSILNRSEVCAVTRLQSSHSMPSLVTIMQ